MRLNIFRSTHLNLFARNIKNKFLRFSKIQDWVGKSAVSHLNCIINELSELFNSRDTLDQNSFEELIARLIYVSETVNSELIEKENMGFRKGSEEVLENMKGFCVKNLRAISESFS